MKKILTIEDETLLLKNILSILTAEGFEALGADHLCDGLRFGN